MRHDDTSLITAAPSEEGSEARPLFSPRALWVIFGGGTISLLLAALLIWFGDPSEEVHSIDADSFSVSALGHQAFKETLLAHDISVHQGRYRPHERVGRGEALVVAEPHLFYDDHTAEAAARLKKYRVMLAASPRTLIVLPKRDGFGYEDQLSPVTFTREDGAVVTKHGVADRWIASSFLVPERDVHFTLEASGLSGIKIVRTTHDASELGPWRGLERYDLEASAPPRIAETQLLMPSPRLEPLISTPYGVLLARVESDLSEAPIWVLSDPDLIATHGLHRGPNAELAKALIKEIGPRGVVLDEVTHGYEQIPTLERRLMQLPMLPITLHLLVLLGFALWTFICRFEPARPLNEARPAGKAFVVGHTASLLVAAGHSAHTAERYIWTVLHDTARALHAPSALSRSQLLAWFDAQHRRREADGGVDLRALTSEVGALADAEQLGSKASSKRLMELAHRADEFRTRMTKG